MPLRQAVAAKFPKYGRDTGDIPTQTEILKLKPTHTEGRAADEKRSWWWEARVLLVVVTLVGLLVVAPAAVHTAGAGRPKFRVFETSMAAGGTIVVGEQHAHSEGEDYDLRTATRATRTVESCPGCSDGRVAGRAVAGCPKGAYMDDDRRERAEAALEDHFQRLYAKGFVAQDFDESMRGHGIREENMLENRPRDWTGYWDGITEDYGYTIFEAPEWPKPSKCAKNWGPTNERYAGREKNSFRNGRVSLPFIVLPSGDVGRAEDAESTQRKKSWVFIFQGFKQGMLFLRTAFKECGVVGYKTARSIERIADEDDVHAIGLARDPMSKIVSAYKEILVRHVHLLIRPQDIEMDVWWHSGAMSRYPGIEQADSCLDWTHIGLPKDPAQMRTHEPSSEMEAARFHGFLEALNCGCRYPEWPHVATSTWWMAMRRTVTHPGQRRGLQKKPRSDNPLLGPMGLSTKKMFAHGVLNRTGYGTPHIDEIWNTVDLSTEIVDVIDRFEIPQNISDIGSRWGGTCENQSATTYFGTTEMKDRENTRQNGNSIRGPESATLHELISEASTAQSICDSFAQDYICFGFEPPRECSELHRSMVQHDLIIYDEGYRGKAAAARHS